MTELQIEIATELSAMGTTLDGVAFWAEVDRLATFGDEWWEQVQPSHRATRPSEADPLYSPLFIWDLEAL